MGSACGLNHAWMNRSKRSCLEESCWTNRERSSVVACPWPMSIAVPSGAPMGCPPGCGSCGCEIGKPLGRAPLGNEAWLASAYGLNRAWTNRSRRSCLQESCWTYRERSSVVAGPMACPVVACPCPMSIADRYWNSVLWTATGAEPRMGTPARWPGGPTTLVPKQRQTALMQIIPIARASLAGHRATNCSREFELQLLTGQVEPARLAGQTHPEGLQSSREG